MKTEEEPTPPTPSIGESREPSRPPPPYKNFQIISESPGNRISEHYEVAPLIKEIVSPLYGRLPEQQPPAIPPKTIPPPIPPKGMTKEVQR